MKENPDRGICVSKDHSGIKINNPSPSFRRTRGVQTRGAARRQLHPHAGESSGRPAERSDRQEAPLSLPGGAGQAAQRDGKGQDPHSLNTQIQTVIYTCVENKRRRDDFWGGEGGGGWFRSVSSVKQQDTSPSSL